MATTANVRTGRGRRMGTVWLCLAAVLLLVATATPLAHAGGPKDKAQIFAIGDDGLTTADPDPDPVTGSWSMLDRDGDAVHAKIRSQVDGGHAYTLWSVIFNNPAACDDPAACGEHDIFVDPADHFPDPDDPLAGFRVGHIQDAQISLVWAGGAVANPAGRLKLDSTQREGEPPDGPLQVLLGTEDGGALVPIGAVDGLVNAAEAQFVLILLDHGPAHDDPELREQQLTMFNGACNPQPADFGVFPPDPGSCVEVQFAVHR